MGTALCCLFSLVCHATLTPRYVVDRYQGPRGYSQGTRLFYIGSSKYKQKGHLQLQHGQPGEVVGAAKSDELKDKGLLMRFEGIVNSFDVSLEFLGRLPPVSARVRTRRNERPRCGLSISACTAAPCEYMG